MKRYCLALDLKDESQQTTEYVAHHKQVWPEVLQSMRDSGIEEMEIYTVGNRLFMIIETTEDFSFERKAQADAENKKVQEWEHLMSRYQQSLPFAKTNEKWVLMNKIFELK